MRGFSCLNPNFALYHLPELLHSHQSLFYGGFLTFRNLLEVDFPRREHCFECAGWHFRAEGSPLPKGRPGGAGTPAGGSCREAGGRLCREASSKAQATAFLACGSQLIKASLSFDLSAQPSAVALLKPQTGHRDVTSAWEQRQPWPQPRGVRPLPRRSAARDASPGTRCHTPASTSGRCFKRSRCLV